MKVNNMISFEVGTFHSAKKNKDYYMLYAVIGEVKQCICFLSKTQYDNILKLKKGD